MQVRAKVYTRQHVCGPREPVEDIATSYVAHGSLWSRREPVDRNGCFPLCALLRVPESYPSSRLALHCASISEIAPFPISRAAAQAGFELDSPLPVAVVVRLPPDWDSLVPVAFGWTSWEVSSEGQS